ncbi:MAG: hypothetical protein A2W31_17475 [Planctomycetes bacterium RBG_16_64_10]|nr:MAG: hypothetical protein A2W31_17475 [Planctomycetes bacterium RBG_16_64_10]
MYAIRLADQALYLSGLQNEAGQDPEGLLTSGPWGPWLSDSDRTRCTWSSGGSGGESATTATTATVHVARFPLYGTLLELSGDEGGCLDEQGLETVAGHLQEIAGDPAGSDVAIDLSLVRFISAKFLDMLYHFWKQLRSRERRLSLWGVRYQCAELLCFGGLDELIDCYRVPHAACRVNCSRVAVARAAP